MELNTARHQEKSTPRHGYLLEKEKIKNEIGDLEQIREHLGLSQRKMCKLLLVDPSAWTRWLNTEGGAPPHIYQALRWLIELKKVNPEAAAPVDISSRVDFIHSSTQSKIRSLEQTVEMLERAVSLAATHTPVIHYPSPPEDSRWADEIAGLKAQIALLIAANRKKAEKSRRKIKDKIKAKTKTQKVNKGKNTKNAKSKKTTFESKKHKRAKPAHFKSRRLRSKPRNQSNLRKSRRQ